MKKWSVPMRQQPIDQPGPRLPSVEFFDQISIPATSGRAKTAFDPLGGPESDGPPINLRYFKYLVSIPTYVKRDGWKAGVHTAQSEDRAERSVGFRRRHDS